MTKISSEKLILLKLDSLVENISEIKEDVKSIKKDVNDIKVSQARLEARFEAQEQIVAELKGSQNKQIWA